MTGLSPPRFKRIAVDNVLILPVQLIWVMRLTSSGLLMEWSQMTPA
jgi:hypothetical protein